MEPTFLNVANIRILFDQEMRRYPAGRDGKVAPQPPHLTRHEGQIIWQDLIPLDFSTTIEKEVTIARNMAKEIEWKLYSHDAPDGLAHALLSAGFKQQPTETIMVGSVELDPVPAIEDYVIKQVTNLEDATAAFDLLLDVFGNSREDSPQTLLETALTRQQFFLGRYQDIAVSCGRLDVPAGCTFGGLYGGATNKAYRGRGFYRPIVHARCLEAKRLGCAYVFSEALPTSRPILQSLGFEPLCEVTGYIYNPA